MSSSWAKVRSVNVLAFLCGWVGGLRDLDDALQEDGLFAREVRLGDWGGSSMPCRRMDCSPERFASETGAVPPCPAGGRTVRPRGSPRRLGRFLHCLLTQRRWTARITRPNDLRPLPSVFVRLQFLILSAHPDVNSLMKL